MTGKIIKFPIKTVDGLYMVENTQNDPYMNTEVELDGTVKCLVLQIETLKDLMARTKYYLLEMDKKAGF